MVDIFNTSKGKVNDINLRTNYGGLKYLPAMTVTYGLINLRIGFTTFIQFLNPNLIELSESHQSRITKNVERGTVLCRIPAVTPCTLRPLHPPPLTLPLHPLPSPSGPHPSLLHPQPPNYTFFSSLTFCNVVNFCESIR